jgi:hemerythrin-like metal-binding protein
MKYQEWQWNHLLETHQPTIDFEHKALFTTINDLIRACNMSEEPNGLLVEVALDELLKYAKHHFSDEETLMEKSTYPDLASHKEQHRKFTDLMNNFKTRFMNNEDISNELITFMQKWLVDHIMNRDKVAMKYCI